MSCYKSWTLNMGFSCLFHYEYRADVASASILNLDIIVYAYTYTALYIYGHPSAWEVDNIYTVFTHTLYTLV